MTMSLERSGGLPADDLPPQAATPVEVLSEDDVPGLTVEDAFAIRELLDASAPQPEPLTEPDKSVTDGWEERARDAQPNRGYAFGESAGPARVRRGVGSTALIPELYLSRRPYGSGMPYRPGQNTLAQFVSREAFRF